MRNLNLFIILSIMALCISACDNKQKEDGGIIGKPSVKVTNGLMTPELLWAFGRVGNVSVSPDGKKVLYSVQYFDIKKNKGNTDLYTMNVDGSDVAQITKTDKSESNAIFTPDGKKIAFLYPEKNDNQLFEMNLDGSDRVQLSHIDGGIEAFKYSPNGQKVLYIKTVKRPNAFQRLYKGLDKTKGRINEDLMYRHWDTWVDSYPHPFVADFDGKQLTNAVDLLDSSLQPDNNAQADIDRSKTPAKQAKTKVTKTSDSIVVDTSGTSLTTNDTTNETVPQRNIVDKKTGSFYECPMRPFGGIEQLAWSPDSKQIAYTCRKKTGKAYTLSTNSDIYLYDITNKTTQNLSEGMMGYDVNPLFSPDGKKIAWESMEHDGYESDKNRLVVYDFDTKKVTDYTKNFDQNVSNLCWSSDNQHIYFISPWHGVEDIYALTIATDSIRRVTNGVHNYTSLDASGNTLIASRQSMSSPTEIYAVNTADGKETQISFVNKELLAQLKMGNVEERWIKTADNQQMLTWVIYPPDFDKTKKYPTLLYCQGGPQDMVSQFWSSRWNFQMMAANGYIVVAPNRRGLPGFGQAWNAQISGDYGGKNMQDYLTAIDEVSKEPFVDNTKLGCVGASYGGFSVYWLAGHHNKRFKAFIAHDGIFNLEQQYVETDEMWFPNWDLGGAFWEKNNAVAQRSYANSPHKFVDKWDTPIMIIHSELDYRIVASQGMAAYNAAVLRGIPARYLYFPDETHWVSKPQNSILWQRCFFDWLDKWLKDPVGKEKWASD